MSTLILRCNKCRGAAKSMLVDGKCEACVSAKVAYTVKGSWPFPTDMLRHDFSRAATEADQALIDRLSGEHAESREDFKPVEINLVSEFKPNTARWESFGWQVPSDEEHAFFKRLKAQAARDEALFQSAIAKLTAEEISVIHAKARHF